MRDHTENLQQLRATFQVEHAERVDALTRLVSGLDAPRGRSVARADILASLFRETHSLKGAARAVEHQHIEHWAHTFEAALVEARRLDGAPSKAWTEAAHAAIAVLAQLINAESTFPPPIFPDLPAQSTDETSEPAVTARREVPDAAEPPAGSTAPEQGAARPSVESVRVSIGKLDALLAQAGELAVTQIRIAQRLTELRGARDAFLAERRDWRRGRSLRAHVRRKSTGEHASASAVARDMEALLQFTEQAEERSMAMSRRIDELASLLQSDVAQLGLVAQAMESDVLAIRLLPVATVSGPLERVVRDLARAQHKEIRLLLEGQDTEIDRKILEQLRDPLMHMVRNSVDHGIEAPDERVARGKPRAGTIRLSIAQRGGAIEIVLADDGAGMDPERMRQSAFKKGFLTEELARALDDQTAIELIFRAGFSTRATANEISGRGVGMDVVREHLERLGGQITPWSVPGEGTRFTIRVPLTLATTRAILVEQGGRQYAIPSSLIERTSRTQEQHIVALDGRRAVAIEGRPVPIVELGDVLELPRADRASETAGWRSFFVLQQDEGRVALLTDQLVGEQEIVVKRLAWPLRRVRNVGGAAVLGSGQTVAILNPSDLLKTALKLSGIRGRRAVIEPTLGPAAPRQRCVLVVDDSLPTRTLERSILETAGYRTLAARDGAEALRILRSEEIDLVVSDIEMPELDGFGLTTEMRRDEKLRQIPVVLVTSLTAPEHRERGVEAGADAYILKGKFDQGQLLDTVGRLIA